MKLRRPCIALCAVALTAVTLCPRLARAWAEGFSAPALRLLSRATMRLPFSLFEWGLAAIAALTLASSLRAALRRGAIAGLSRLLRACLSLLLAAAICLGALWLPLYHRSPARAAHASDAQLSALCATLIESLNAAALDFSALPDDLPAKPAALPFWMDAMGVTGFFAFPTGEALYAPSLPAASIPFVAVHEQMHGLGCAGEGAANIAAYEACVARGGAYADSARLWALKYAMGLLSERDRKAAADCRAMMRPQTRRAYLEAGGGGRSQPPKRAVLAAFAALGLFEPATDYEALALHLASQIAV